MSFDAVKTERDSPRAIAVAGWLISAIAIVGVAITFVPTPERSDYFWYRILWAEFLAGLVWGFTGGFITSSLFAKKSPRSQGGILPTLGVVVVIYAVLSLALMLKQAYTHETDFLDRFHLTLQIVLLAVTGILCVFLQLSQTAAAHGLEPLAEGMQSPPELCDLLRLNENRLLAQASNADARKLFDAVKELRESIQFSVQQMGSIGKSDGYRRFAEEAAQLCRELESIGAGSVESGLANRLRERASVLHQQASHLSHSSTVKR
jgi:hypothetical protein